DKILRRILLSKGDVSAIFNLQKKQVYDTFRILSVLYLNDVKRNAALNCYLGEMASEIRKQLNTPEAIRRFCIKVSAKGNAQERFSSMSVLAISLFDDCGQRNLERIKMIVPHFAMPSTETPNGAAVFEKMNQVEDIRHAKTLSELTDARCTQIAAEINSKRKVAKSTNMDSVSALGLNGNAIPFALIDKLQKNSSVRATDFDFISSCLMNAFDGSFDIPFINISPARKREVAEKIGDAIDDMKNLMSLSDVDCKTSVENIRCAYIMLTYISMLSDATVALKKEAVYKEIVRSEVVLPVGNAKTQRTAAETSLRLENQQLKQKIAELSAAKASSAKREGAIKKRLEDAESTNVALKAELDLSKEDKSRDVERPQNNAVQASQPKQVEIPYHELLSELLENKRVVVIGGDLNFVKNLLAAQPKLESLDKENLGLFESSVRGADYVLMRYSSMSHGIYDKAKSICKRRGIEYGYIEGKTSIPLVEKSIYNTLTHKKTKKKEN
ncbi:MAG: hypothetical protein RR284_06315, partial [Ruthenibacterium sp.]